MNKEVLKSAFWDVMPFVIVVSCVVMMGVAIWVGGTYMTNKQKEREVYSAREIRDWEDELALARGPDVRIEHDGFCRWMDAGAVGQYADPDLYDRLWDVAVAKGAADPDRALARWCGKRRTPEIRYRPGK